MGERRGHVRIGLEVEALVPAGVFTERDLPDLQARLVRVMHDELARAVEERSGARGDLAQGGGHEDEGDEG